MEPIRVLHVLGGLFHGGAEAMIMSLYRHMDTSKVQFDFLVHTDQEGVYDKEIIERGGEIHHAPEYHGYNHLAYKAWWRSFLKEYPEYHILHFHIRGTAAIAIPVARNMGRITIAHSHNTSNGNRVKAVIKNFFQRSLRKDATYLFACSEPAGTWLFGKNVLQAKNFFLWKNAIDVDSFTFSLEARKKMRDEFKIQDSFVVGHVSRFSSAKNHMFLLEIFKDIHQKNPRSKLLLVGDGELRESIERRIKELNLEDAIIITGFRADVPDIMQAMDVFLFPSLFEGLPVTLIEAQASGLVVVASDKIAPEVQVTPLLHFISLDEPASYWSDFVLNYTHSDERVSPLKEIASAGYDSLQSAKELQEFYLRISNME
jgi:glycosyltransferase involved in cell wall biosynthesis